MTEDQIGILIASTDSYADLWPITFACLRRYWPDCPYEMHLGANQQAYHDDSIKTILVGRDADWSSSLDRMLAAIPHEFILLWMEDQLLSRRVDTDRVRRYVAYMQRRQAAYLRLTPTPPFGTPGVDHPELGEVAPGTPYRISLFAAVWRKDVLRRLLQSGESAWALELQGSQRTDAIASPFLAITEQARSRAPIHQVNALRRGRWSLDGIGFLAQEGIDISSSRRPRQTRAYLLYERIAASAPVRQARAAASKCLPRGAKPALRSLGSGLWQVWRSR
ncbi:MAG: hypothetical protein HY690_15225 [Chloroflexi bacterium]|nr:hypothetical protein [Chloroflexota bacterium]